MDGFVDVAKAHSTLSSNTAEGAGGARLLRGRSSGQFASGGFSGIASSGAFLRGCFRDRRRDRLLCLGRLLIATGRQAPRIANTGVTLECAF